MISITDPHHISTHQLAQLHRYAGIGFLSSFFNALILIIIFWNQVEHTQLLAWFAVVIIACSTRLIYARGHQEAKRELLSTGRQSNTMLLITAFNGLIWGGLALVIYPHVQLPYQMFLIFMLSIVSAGALPLYIASPWTYILFLSTVLIPIITTLSINSQSTEQFMALMLAIFATTLAITARTMHQCLMESLHKHSGYQTLASVDNLTQLANRRAFDDAIVSEWNRAARSRLPVSVIMIDVDNFKKYNDTYGHQEGDKCLEEVARVLGNSLRRSGDLIARYGGEEFVAVLYQTTRDEAVALAEKMRNAVTALELPHKENSTGYVTISLGGATCIPNPKESPNNLVKSADEALYEAKQAGRDQVRWHSIITERVEDEPNS